MNRILRISLLLVVGFAIGRLSHERSANAQVADRPPPCQDVNGDGKSDLADAVFLLNWLFGGGAGPECPSDDQPVGLPDTGQTTCYDQNGRVIDCTSDTCAGQDGLYATGCPSEGRFVDNGDGTVTDTCTRLMWQQDTADVNGDGLRNEGDQPPWCSALAYCEDLELAGHDDWRLPNITELQSIVDHGRFSPRSIRSSARGRPLTGRLRPHYLQRHRVVRPFRRRLRPRRQQARRRTCPGRPHRTMTQSP